MDIKEIVIKKVEASLSHMSSNFGLVGNLKQIEPYWSDDSSFIILIETGGNNNYLNSTINALENFRRHMSNMDYIDSVDWFNIDIIRIHDQVRAYFKVNTYQ